MKTKLVFIFLVNSVFYVKSQTAVLNDKLLNQLTKNQAVRLASNKGFFDSYEKQTQIYNDVNTKIEQILAIQYFIYDKLVNINEGIKQGKELIYIIKYFGEIGSNAQKVLQYTASKPQFAVLLSKYYIQAYQQLTLMKTELFSEIMNEKNDFLMDPFDRTKILSNLLMRARTINGCLVTIIWALDASKERPYIYQIPFLNNYINLDKAIVNDIIQQYKYIFN